MLDAAQRCICAIRGAGCSVRHVWQPADVFSLDSLCEVAQQTQGPCCLQWLVSLQTHYVSHATYHRPDWEACSALAAAVVNASCATKCRPPACALGAPQPATAGATFYALTGAPVKDLLQGCCLPLMPRVLPKPVDSHLCVAAVGCSCHGALHSYQPQACGASAGITA